MQLTGPWRLEVDQDKVSASSFGVAQSQGRLVIDLETASEKSTCSNKSSNKVDFVCSLSLLFFF